MANRDIEGQNHFGVFDPRQIQNPMSNGYNNPNNFNNQYPNNQYPNNQYPNNNGANNYNNYDTDSANNYNSGIGNESKGLFSAETRLAFIRKVYSILTAQILVTVLVCAAAIYNTSFNNFILDRNNVPLLYICLALTIVVSITLVCYQSVARSVPVNYILLCIFTFCEAYIVALLCAFSKPKLVLMAAILTLAMFLALTAYAFTTKEDFTMMGGTLFVAGMVFLIAGLFMMFSDNNIAHIVYSSLGVILFSLYIVYDTQLLMDNKQLSFTLDDYIVAALQLYLDIVNIFIYILDILNRTTD